MSSEDVTTADVRALPVFVCNIGGLITHKMLSKTTTFHDTAVLSCRTGSMVVSLVFL